MCCIFSRKVVNACDTGRCRIGSTCCLSLIDELSYFQKKKETIEAELEAAMDTLQLGKILQSMLGVGPIISAAFVGEVGDISRFSSWKQVRSLAGLNLVENSSGKHKSKTKVSKRGRTYLRHMLYMAGDAVADVTLKCERFTDICEIARTIRSTAIKRLWQLASR